MHPYGADQDQLESLIQRAQAFKVGEGVIQPGYRAGFAVLRCGVGLAEGPEFFAGFYSCDGPAQLGEPACVPS